MKLEILKETPDLLLVNKPSGLLTMPGRGEDNGPHLLGLLSEKYGEVMVVHRLDRDASGIILFARNAEAHRYYSGLFESREMDKKYLVLVEGIVKAGRGEIDKPLLQRGSGRVSVAFNGKPSLTRYSVMERLKGATLLEVSIVTGRRHQIRAHFYSEGHPVMGDPAYGPAGGAGRCPRLMLHSWKLRFTDMAGKTSTTSAEPPPDFLGVLRALGY